MQEILLQESQESLCMRINATFALFVPESRAYDALLDARSVWGNLLLRLTPRIEEVFVVHLPSGKSLPSQSHE